LREEGPDFRTAHVQTVCSEPSPDILTDGARRLHPPAQTFFGSGLALSYLKDID